MGKGRTELNGKPHTHELQIQDRHWDRRWRIQYGDQHTNVVQWMPGSKKRLERKARNIIAVHDRESVKAQSREDMMTRLCKVNEQLTYRDSSWTKRGRDDVWGSELLNVGDNGRGTGAKSSTLLHDANSQERGTI